MQDECTSAQNRAESGAEGYVAMRLDVTGGTSLVGFVGGSRANGGVLQNERGRNRCTCTRCASTPLRTAICREYSGTSSTANSFADKTDLSYRF